MIEKILKEDQNLHNFVVIVVLGHTKGRGFKRPQREQQQKPQERSFYGHMRKNQNLQIDKLAQTM